ncbi:MAG: type II secretion system F family protein [Verrucomicrobiota bacterium]|nr:type II secretion system F family protein [Verrucomicrobiota bacterium]MDI9383000.1 type II secretion system F family protein [Verrucomicrobiota bacterium]
MNFIPLIFIATALAVGLGIFALLDYLQGGHHRFVQRFNDFRQVPDFHDWERRSLKEPALPQSSMVLKILAGIRSLAGEEYFKRIDTLLKQADIALRPTEYVLVKVSCFVMGSLIANSMGGKVMIASIIGIICWLAPTIVAKRKRAKRIKLFEQQLADILDLIVSSLRAGQSFMQALDAACENAPYPSGKEFRRLLAELRMGIPADRAMHSLVERMPSQDMEMIVVAYLIQRTVGGPLSEVLENVGRTIRERAKIRGDIETLTAQGRISGIVIGSLPLALAAILFLINPTFILPLFTEPIGRLLLLIAIMMQVTGALLIRSIVRIEF